MVSYKVELEAWEETVAWEKANGAPIGLFSGPKPTKTKSK